MTLQATFCATLVDEWVRGGVHRAVIAPGSRSAPLAIALFADGRLDVYVRLDERSAAFFALGIALDSGEPVIVLTTSGTASSELHAAVLEADLARVPLIVATADRPFELQRVGAPQTVDQADLFGSAVRYFGDPGVADEAAVGSWRSFASRALVEAVASPKGPGPVHVNLPFREPLVGSPDALPIGRWDGAPWHEVVIDRSPGDALLFRFLAAVRGRRGVVIVGGSVGREAASGVVAFAERIGWPVLADPRALPRDDTAVLVCHVDGIVRSPVAREALTPEVVVRVGSPHASKELGVWCGALATDGVPQILIDPIGAFEDPDRGSSLVLRADPGALLIAAVAGIGLDDVAPEEWSRGWHAVDAAAERAIGTFIDGQPGLSEPAVARAVFSSARPGSVVVVSSSMPVRDLEWFGAQRKFAPAVISNRGANGIDGVTSTVLGVATSASRRGGDVIAVTGDLAFLYDLSGLVFGIHEEVPDATFVVVDNAGGGIFSFLPYPGVVDDATFERAFSTPQRPDIAEIVRALGHNAVEVTTVEEVSRVVGNPVGGITVVVVRTDRAANVEFHAELGRRIVAEVEVVLVGGLSS